jgi:hypothetical protein
MILRCFCLPSAAAASNFARAIVGVPTLGFSQTFDQQNVGHVVIHYTTLNKAMSLSYFSRSPQLSGELLIRFAL